MSGDSSGLMVTDDLDIAEELLAISMTEEYNRQILKSWRAYELKL